MSGMCCVVVGIGSIQKIPYADNDRLIKVPYNFFSFLFNRLFEAFILQNKIEDQIRCLVWSNGSANSIWA